ncbi:syntaxin-binding protein 5 isoform X3 [Panthera pardus]|uniref:V-SNARE coiled-coil homology domain-containing protein n=4 Tax=Felidae TaxID=9681 RepID=A0ABI7WZE0_FELCA|nr:syntaxin-binding protein 5 isoform X4 [Panthera tigris]XP_011280880.1 syntaxin-binding protein 5 isoform X3 [Felis catus]XP_019280571.1 syntaxin-binding protein 5 isoform X3 [Panthera pardus]XP_026912486.1 syntaxin-binding protein 5 isoform X5 [Acinonyx jubatus]XP_042795971.1 syntaxin-binding protein 5 isoform X4 [Panthera leo]XP_049510454.1 syntaxin-binding protein 5 isoform X4 [Panthera uncia]XP_058591554.1 syntaxin-binding protein 5 isoform X4 [Neofelis nebulosa]XP_060472844.1 syntaxin
MRKFNIRKVLDGLTAGSSSASQQQQQQQHPAGNREPEIQETLQSEHFQLCKTVRHGFPYQPSALAFDPVQKILAVGTQTGALRLFGRPGVECYCQHDSGAAVIQLQFLINEGALVSALADDTLHLWNLRQKRPAILHSLKFCRERVTFCHLPFQSKWLYVGTERGNIHIVNVESFTLSGYVIMWNKAIELSSKSHPGPVVHISDNPMDEGKLLIGFESGTVVLWDLKSKKADYRYTYDEAIHSVAWHHEGKQFICSHSDGTLTIWNVRSPAKPVQTITPHGKQLKDGKKPEPCKPILKVEFKTTRSGEPFIILSGGLSYDTVGRRPCLTVMHGKSTAVLEMDYSIVDFLTLCETPYPNDFQEPYAVVVLLEKDLVLIDLAQNGYPIFENPYPLSIHESPVTCCEYFADCPVDLIPALYSVGARQKRQGYSKKEWPINGGNWGLGVQSYPEIIITGHADGSVKFWDASAITLQVLYKLKTSKVFEKSRNKDDRPNTDIVDEDPYAIQIISWCPESRMLCIAGVSAHVIIYRFSKQEVITEVIPMLEVRLLYEISDVESPEGEQAPPLPTPVGGATPQPIPPQSHPSTSSSSSDGLRDNVPCLKVKNSPLKQSPGYQTELVIQLVWVSGEPPQQITSLAVNSSYGLVVFGNCNGIAMVDYLQKAVLLNLGTIELYGSNDPYRREPRSPRKSRQPSGAGLCDISEGTAVPEDRCKSPTSAKMSRKLSLPTDLKPDLDIKDNSFSRSRSSSVTSIDKESREAISALHFCETFTRKADSSPSPCLWVGTTLGTVLVIALNLPPGGEQRLLQPVIVSPSGTILRLKGAILRMAFLDTTGCLVPPAYESWREHNVPEEKDEKEKSKKRRPVSVSPSSSQEICENQYAVICSEKQAKVISLPSQNCAYKQNITETSFVLRGDIVALNNSICLACFCANGHIMTFSLPSLRPLLDVYYLPLTNMRIARTFCFTNNGQALYLVSPTEIQRLTYSQETCENLQEMLGELFTPVETPEAPNRGFFKGLFGGGAQSLDREELFGESSSGKASRSLAQHIPGPGGIEGVKGAASGVVGELARARLALDERGQKLGDLEERTAAMLSSADSFSKHAHEMMLKYKDKKWYQF